VLLSLANIKGRVEIKKISTANILSEFDIEINEKTSLMADCLSELSSSDRMVYLSEKEFNTIIHILDSLKKICKFDCLKELLKDSAISLFFCDMRAITTDPDLDDRETAWVNVYKAFVLYLDKGYANRTPWSEALYGFVSDSLMYYFQTQLMIFSNKRLTKYLN
jgi:hypothetical protein